MVERSSIQFVNRSYELGTPKPMKCSRKDAKPLSLLFFAPLRLGVSLFSHQATCLVGTETDENLSQRRQAAKLAFLCAFAPLREFIFTSAFSIEQNSADGLTNAVDSLSITYFNRPTPRQTFPFPGVQTKRSVWRTDSHP